MNLKVSVVVPAFNAESFIGETLTSILSQTYTNIEILVVDDGSTDSTYEICKAFSLKNKNIRLLTHENRINRGVSFSRKLAIDKAEGDFIAFCDADDIMMPGKIEKQVEVFKRFDDIILVHTGLQAFGSDETFCREFENKMKISDVEFNYNLLETDYWLNRNKICNSTVMVKTEHIKKIDFFYDQMFQTEDWLTWILLAQFGNFRYIPETLSKYRFHEDSITAKIQTKMLYRLYSKVEFYLTILKKVPRLGLYIRLKIWYRMIRLLFNIKKIY